MPEGDTIYRTAEVMRRTLRDDVIVAARGRPGGAQLERVVGSRTSGVRTRGKHLLIEFDSGLTLHTHMGMRGSWHRYRPGERWREDAAVAVASLETDSAVAVCFEAPTVELIETRALAIHPALSKLGPDLLDPNPDIDEAMRRLRRPALVDTAVGDVLLDQSVVAGIGNVYRNEVLADRRVSPFATVGSLEEDTLRVLLTTAATLLRGNLDGRERATVPGVARGERWVYRRAGRPCRRCGTLIRSTTSGRLPRRIYWCPLCQASPR